MNIYALAVLSLPALASAVSYPVGITNCGVPSWIQSTPKRAVTMNQGTTEIMLALNLSDHMVGTAYLDDAIWSELEADYNKIPVLSDSYPDIDTLMAKNPDFIYASYSSAFATSHVNYTTFLDVDCTLTIERKGGNRTHCRKEIHGKGIQTYLQKPACELTEHRPIETSSVKVLYDEIWEIANIFNVYENGRTLVDSIEGHFNDAAAVAAEADSDVPPISVLWLDGWSKETPFVGACCGSINTIVESAGAKHIFDDQGIEKKKTWDSVTWDAIADRDPDVIVLVDASWDLADEKVFHLCSNAHTRELRAVKNRAFIVVPFSASTLGVRIGSLAYNLAEAMAALIRGTPVPSLQFTYTSITNPEGNVEAQTVGKSGVRVYDKLPIWNGTDLNELCEGSNVPIQIREDLPLATTDDSDDTLALGLGLGLGIACLVLLVVAVMYMQKSSKMEKELEEMKLKSGATSA
jgi:iron complex transport system substrate-binding protein